ncbi:MAG: transcription termination/antitermination protein NusG [Acidobacteriaceae bacterium]
MSTWTQTPQFLEVPSILNGVEENSSSRSWYAITTRSQHERLVARQLQSHGITTLLPILKEIHRWSDRRKIVEMPMFRGYLFVRCCMSPASRRAVLFARGVVNFVTMQGEPVPIPEEQINNIHRVMTNHADCVAHPFLKIGQRVRIRGGALDGMEGILSSFQKDRCVVVSIDAIQRSLAVRIEGYDLEAA